MQKNNNEKQAAIKLLNKYAEEYHVLEDQVSMLRKENNDLKSNLQINKEIIQGFFQKVSLDDKINLYISKLKEENKLMSSKLQLKDKDLIAFKSKVTSFEQTVNIQFNTYKEELEKYKTETFLLENMLQEKENIIQSLSKKLKKNQGNDSGEKLVEVYITNPNDLINKLNDKLELYKDINAKLSTLIKSLKAALVKNEKLALAYESENIRYKQELNVFKQQKNNSTILAQMGQTSVGRIFTSKNSTPSESQSIVTTSKLNKSSNNVTYDHINPDHMLSKSRRTMIKEIKKLEGMNKNKQSINQFDLTEEWYETLKHCSLSQEEYVRYCKNKQMMKLTDVIEYLYKLIIDKNIQIKLLTEENDCLNIENLNLNKINIEISEEIEILKSNKDSGEYSTSNFSHRKKNDRDNSTFVNVDEKTRDNFIFTYITQVKESISSSEFREGMILDQFDLASEMSKMAGCNETIENENIDQIKISTNI